MTFLDGGVALGTAQRDGNGQAVLLVNALTSGPHSLTASCGGDASDQASTSDPFILTLA